MSSLAIERAVQSCVNDIAGLRGCVNLVRVRKNSKLTDRELEREVWNVLDDAANPIFKYDVEVKSGVAKVSFFYEDEVYPTELKSRIESISGIISLNLIGTAILKENIGKRELCRSIMETPPWKRTI